MINNQALQAILDEFREAGIEFTRDGSFGQQMIDYLNSQEGEAKLMSEPYGRHRPYYNARKASKDVRTKIKRILHKNNYEHGGTDILLVDGKLYLIDHSSESEFSKRSYDEDGFGIRNTYNPKTIKNEQIKEIIKNIAADYAYSETLIQYRLQELGIDERMLSQLNIAAELQSGVGNNDMLDARGGESRSQTDDNRSSALRGENQRDGGTEPGIGQRDGEEIKYLRTKNGTVYGFTYKGKIYLDPKLADVNTAIHEYTHLWAEMIRQQKPKLWQEIKAEMKQLPVWKEILNNPNYKKIHGDEDAMADEVLATFSGRQGKARIDRMMQRIDREIPNLSDREVA